MIFWALAALLTGLVAALLVPPLIGRMGARTTRKDAGLAVYRAQLEEIGRDRERGILGAEEAATLRLETQRRMLKAAGARAEEAQAWRAPPAAALAAAALIPAAALALYLWIGEPGLSGQPRGDAQDRHEAASDPRSAEIAGLVAELERRMAGNPEDPVGWRLLANAQVGLGRWADGAASYARAVAAGGGDAETLAAWAEALILAAGGAVSPPAAELLARALAADPDEPRARYYRGLARLQAGAPEEALAVWRALAEESPADAPWTGFLEERIRLAEAMTAPPGPDADEMAAVADLAPEERAAAIRGMVQRLADRLEREPEDIDGWLRLAHAYGVLEEPQKRRAALEQAGALAPERADIQLQLAEAEAGAGEAAAAAQRLEKLLAELPADAAERVPAEAALNRLRDRE